MQSSPVRRKTAMRNQSWILTNERRSRYSGSASNREALVALRGCNRLHESCLATNVAVCTGPARRVRPRRCAMGRCSVSAAGASTPAGVRPANPAVRRPTRHALMAAEVGLCLVKTVRSRLSPPSRGALMRQALRPLRIVDAVPSAA